MPKDRLIPCLHGAKILDRDPEDEPIYTGHSSLNTTKGITFLFIVQSLLHGNPANIWISRSQSR